MHNTDTIAAIATPMSSSGIGIIRISGDEAVRIADQIFMSPSGKKLAQMESHTIHYGHIKSEDKLLDEVMVLLMNGPRTYTREDTVEIDCHGGVLVLNRVLEAVVRHGARLAEPGEFTKRAFLNGRIDLAQAESVIDIINAKNEFALSASMNQLQGLLSDKVKSMRAAVIHEIAFIESALDDPEHITMDAYEKRLDEIVTPIIEDLENLLRNADQGSVLKEGINTVIVGKPNAGKSSLMNLLVRKDRAIVTDIAGTTRDIIEEQILLEGISLNIIDTAGIRDTNDLVEQIGVNKAKEYVERADLVIYVVDTSTDLDQDDLDIMQLIQGRKGIVLLNKADLDSVIDESVILQHLKMKVLSFSAKESSGLKELEKIIMDMFISGEINGNDQIFITNQRQKALLRESYESLLQVKESIQLNMPEDFYSIDLMNAYESMGRLIGESVEDDLVNEIFSKFCMGK